MRKGRKRSGAALAAIVAWCLLLGTVSGPAAGYAAEETDAQTGYVSEEKTDAQTGYAYVIYEEDVGEGVTVRRAEITGYGGAESVLDIPKKVGGYEVGGIGAGAFQGNAQITGVAIPEGVAHIGREAFQGCEKLVKVTVPSTVADWDDGVSMGYDSSAFRGCAALTDVMLAEGLAVLGQRTFADCTSLQKITIPSTVREFHNKTFSGCTALREVDLRDGIEEIGHQAFADCTALEQASIPASIQRWSLIRASSIMSTPRDCSPFYGCTALKKIAFEEGIKTLAGFQGSRGCPLVEELDIPASVEDVSYAFTNCASLKKVILHDGMKTIGESAFQGCSGLAEMQVPETVEHLGANAFKGCSSMERLVLPSSVRSMEGGVTDGCTGLGEVYLLADAVKWYQGLQMASDGKLYCMEGSSTYNTYLSRMPEGDRDKLTALPATGATAKGITAVYDGMDRGAVTVEGIQAGDQILYRVNDGISQAELPKIAEPGSYQVTVMVKSMQSGKLAGYSCLRVDSLIEKRRYSMHLPDVEAEEGEEYALTVLGYEGDATPEYTYYEDEACTRAWDGKPGMAGVYYARASVPETEYDQAVVSNTAKITIHGKNTNPSASQSPDASTASPAPGQSGDAFTASPAPGQSGDVSTASPAPGQSGDASTASPAPDPNSRPGGTSGAVQRPKRTAKPQTAPRVGRVTIKKAKLTKKKTLQIQWKKVSGASGYQVQIALNRKCSKGKKSYQVAKGKTIKKTVKRLKKRKYYVRMRAYCKRKGKKYYGTWSKVKKVQAPVG